MDSAGFSRITAEEWLRKPGSVGRPWPGSELRILDETGRELPRYEIGLIYVRSPHMQFRYRGAEEKTQQAFRDGCSQGSSDEAAAAPRSLTFARPSPEG